MEITKKIKTTPKNMDTLFDIGANNINLRFFEITDCMGCNFSDDEYENEKYTYKCIFRIDEKFADELKKARGYNGVWKLIKKYDSDCIKEYVEQKMTKLQKEIEELKKLV